MTAPRPADTGAGGRPLRDAAKTDQRVIRRALVAGSALTGVLAVMGVAAAVLAGGGGALGLAAVVTAVTLGALVTAAWLLLSVLFDLLAGRVPGPRRLIWGLVIGLVAFIGPVFVLGALSAAT